MFYFSNREGLKDISKLGRRAMVQITSPKNRPIFGEFYNPSFLSLFIGKGAIKLSNGELIKGRDATSHFVISTATLLSPYV